MQSLEKSQEQAAGLQVALENRQVIGQAIGILMASQGVDEQAAFAQLVPISQHQNQKVRQVALPGVVADRRAVACAIPGSECVSREALVDARDRLRRELGEAMAGSAAGLPAADRLCRACVDLLGVDGAAISLMHRGELWGTFGSSGELSRRLDALQFTFGEGPCMDAVESCRPVLADDLGDDQEQRWPAFRGAVLDSGVRAVFALPVTVAHATVGALDLFNRRPGPLSEDELHGGLWAAELASLPLLALMTADVDWDAVGESKDGWDQLASLERVEVYQATGMIIGQLDVDAAEALVRLRAYAYAQGLTASEAAWAIVERRVRLEDEESFRTPPGGTTGTPS